MYGATLCCLNLNLILDLVGSCVEPVVLAFIIISIPPQLFVTQVNKMVRGYYNYCESINLNCDK